ncbi:hypothetical protein FHL15_008458 [Xylaria flabelliformis]|uniref:Uncharacterized protein n=1 Tax=Xylaria flabelliformis TaxID=2512241 RepID=A0A553HRW6_9PEZI|nr:hypothetical protein FHL15_008458 [Xylaria flabelliformis]
MSTTVTDQNQSAPAKDTEQQTTTETASTNDASRAENGTDSGASQEQNDSGPRVLRSHYRGMPNQWEKNQRPKKDGE